MTMCTPGAKFLGLDLKDFYLTGVLLSLPRKKFGRIFFSPKMSSYGSYLYPTKISGRHWIILPPFFTAKKRKIVL